MNINPPPTASKDYTLKPFFIQCVRMSKTEKIKEKQTSKKEKNNFDFYGLVEGKIKVLLWFYFSSTFYHYTIILYYTLYYTTLYYTAKLYFFGGGFYER